MGLVLTTNNNNHNNKNNNKNLVNKAQQMNEMFEQRNF